MIVDRPAGKLGNVVVGAGTGSVLVGIDNLAYKERCFRCLQAKVLNYIFVNILRCIHPTGIIGIGLTLMHENTFYHTCFLRLLSKTNKPSVWVIVIFGGNVLHPACGIIYIIGAKALIENLYGTAGYGHHNHPNSIFGIKTVNQITSKIVNRRKTCVASAQRRCSRGPFPHVRSIAVGCVHLLETVAHTGFVPALRLSVALHVGLSETEEDKIVFRERRGLCFT
ncbi:MAG: hypothetical protein BWY95_01002 [Bacteroidetes bacterium ADurb.BinA104]|nr:MAG: hypothetical protein BWY95_01002 [Bacteroidetes bacterium ADurb.BinA104]